PSPGLSFGFVASRDLPQVSPCVPHHRAAVAIGHIDRLLDRDGTGSDGAPVRAISVFDVNVEKGWHGFALAAAVADHDDRLTDLPLRRHAALDGAASIEHGLEKSHQAGDVAGDDPWHHGWPAIGLRFFHLISAIIVLARRLTARRYSPRG